MSCKTYDRIFNYSTLISELVVVFVIVNFYCVQVQATWFVLFAGNVALIDEIRENVDAKFDQRRDVVRIERFNKTKT